MLVVRFTTSAVRLTTSVVRLWASCQEAVGYFDLLAWRAR